jgi:hypothetical protein
MYNGGHTTYEVATELDITPDKAEKYRFDYGRLHDTDEFELFYKEVKGRVGPIISLHNELMAKNLNVGNVMERAKKIDLRENLDEEIKAKHKYKKIQEGELNRIKTEKQSVERMLTGLRNATTAELRSETI